MKKGTKHTKETREKIRNGVLANPNRYWKGKNLSEETKNKLSLSHKGRTSNRKGAKLSEETRKRISLSKKGTKPWNTGKKRPEMTGENSPNWNGGSSFFPYSLDWTCTLRVSVRERDKYTCQICSEKQGDIAFHVHHIDYDKKNCNPNNLITLCHSCHSKTNSNREYWMRRFTYENCEHCR